MTAPHPTYVLATESGTTQPSSLAFFAGQATEPMSIGRKGTFLLNAVGVEDVHAHVFFNGSVLYVKSAEGTSGVRIGGYALGTTWTEVRAPCILELGRAKLRFATARPIDSDDVATASLDRPPVDTSSLDEPARTRWSRPDEQTRAPAYRASAPSHPGQTASSGDSPTAENQRARWSRPNENVTPALPGGTPIGPSMPPRGEIGPVTPPDGVTLFAPVEAPLGAPAPRSLAPPSPLTPPGPPMPLSVEPPRWGQSPTLNTRPTEPERTEHAWIARFKALPPTRRLMIVMSPGVLVALSVLFFAGDSARPKSAPKNGKATTAVTAAPASSTAPPPASPQCPAGFVMYGTPSNGVITCVPRGTTGWTPPPSTSPHEDVGATAETAPTAAAKPDEAVGATQTAPTTTGTKTLERRAVDLVAEGRFAEAAKAYEQLLQQNPNQRVYAEATRILRAKSETK